MTKMSCFKVLQSGCWLLTVFVAGCQKPLPPPPEPIVPAVQFHYHTVKYPGETLGSIAKWYTDDTSNWELILDANPGLDPRRIRLGDEIAIPEELVRRREEMPRPSVPLVRKKVEQVRTEGEPEEGAESSGAVPSVGSDEPQKNEEGLDTSGADPVQEQGVAEEKTDGEQSEAGEVNPIEPAQDSQPPSEVVRPDPPEQFESSKAAAPDLDKSREMYMKELFEDDL